MALPLARLPLVAALVCAGGLLSACDFSSIAFGPGPNGKKPAPALAQAIEQGHPPALGIITSGDDLMVGLDQQPMAYADLSGPANINALITKYAQIYNIPEELIHRQVKRESNYNPAARNGPYWGLMQIRHDTAASMGYTGTANGLLDAETNLKYACKYLRGAFLVAQGSIPQAMRFYASGYYYDAKRMGLLEEVGLR